MKVVTSMAPRLLAAFALALALGGLAGQANSSNADAQKPTAPPAYPEFPQGQGRDTVLRKCGMCHSPTVIAATGQDRQGWENTVLKMIDFGLTGTDEEFTEVVDYLTKAFPPSAKLNINAASASQIVSVLGLAEDEAKAIVDFRTKNGKFETFDDLKKVPNLSIGKLEAKKESITF